MFVENVLSHKLGSSKLFPTQRTQELLFGNFLSVISDKLLYFAIVINNKCMKSLQMGTAMCQSVPGPQSHPIVEPVGETLPFLGQKVVSLQCDKKGAN